MKDFEMNIIELEALNHGLQNRNDHFQERIAELESERDMWKATAEAVVDFEKSQMRLRIESLEAARMAYAREFALNTDGEPDVGNIHANIRAMKDALRVALNSLENSIDCVRAAYETDWRHGLLTRKAQLDSMKQDYEAHEAAIKQVKEVLNAAE